MTEVLDAYNENTVTYSGKECSVVTYKNFANVSINASMANATMDYNDNNVLSVNLAGADAGNITVGEIESITAGLSQFGVADLQIRPKLMKGTISCLYTTSVGSKSIPVTMTDIYGNIYRTTVSVQVTQRVKQAGDFDWDELAAQQEDSNSIYNHYKKMLEIRNTYTDVFARGNRKLIANSNTDGYDVFSRSYNGTTLYVGLNIKVQEKTVNVKLNGGVGAVYKDLYSGTEYTASSYTVSVTIPAAEDGGTVVLVCTKAGTSSSGGSSSSDGTNVTTVTNNPDGTSTTATVIKKVNSAGKTVEVTTSVTKAENGSVIGTEEVTVIKNPAKNTSVVVSVQKDAAGTVKEAVADVTKTGTVSAKDTKVTVSAAVTAQIKEAAGTDDVVITTTVTDSRGEEKYTVTVNSKDLVTGEKLQVVAVDKKTGEYVLVNAKNYKVNEKGNVTVTLPDGKDYVLLSSQDAYRLLLISYIFDIIMTYTQDILYILIEQDL